MQFERFIAQRISRSQSAGGSVNTRPMVRLTIIGVAMSLIVMLLSVSIMQGFKTEVKSHAYSLSGHITIGKFGSTPGANAAAVTLSDSLVQVVRAVPGVSGAMPVVRTMGMVRTDSAYSGILMTGLDKSYDLRFFRKNLVCGSLDSLFVPTPGVTPIVLPRVLTDKLNIQVGDKLKIYFFGEQIKFRPFRLIGIYESATSLEKSMAICPIDLLQRIGGLNAYEYSALLVNTQRGETDLAVTERIIDHLEAARSKLHFESLGINTAEELYPEIFGWLDMLDGNVALLLVLMVLVAGFTMITGLIILVLDNTQLIASLMAMGATTTSIRKIFFYLSSVLIIKGVFLGNLIALALALFQRYTHLIKLDPQTYLMDAVPVSLDWFYWLIVNFGAILLILLMIWVPTRLVVQISPTETMRFK